MVSASAGTGKTAVLVERIVRMATDEFRAVDIDRMLIVTFTKAAAAEMRERIRNALSDRIKKDPENISLRRQLILLNQANISTIHSFCSDVIRSNYHLLDINPAFGVCDAMESEVLIDEALESLLDSMFEYSTEVFRLLMDNYGRGRDDSALSKLIKGLYRYIRSMPGYKKWLSEKAAMFEKNTDDFGDTVWGRELLSYAKIKLHGLIAEMADIMSLIKDDVDFTGYYSTLSMDMALLEEIGEVFESGSWDECNSRLENIKFSVLLRASKNADKEIQTLVKAVRNGIKEDVNKLGVLILGQSSEIFRNIEELSPLIGCLADLTARLDDEYSALKNKKGILDYNDLEHLALKCLESEAGEMYRNRFDEVLVDEYQDSNPIQDRLINLVSGRNRECKNVFMVGDVKQSIYKFRQAMPEIFLDKYNSYSDDREQDEVRIELFRNYRSRKPVLDLTNYIFSKIMSVETAGIDYNEAVSLKPGIEYPDGDGKGYPVDVRIICGKDEDIFTDDVTKEKKEAAVVGMEIIKILKSGMMITDRKNNRERPVELRDISILLRTVKKTSGVYAEQLKAMGIPAYADGNSDFYGETEIAVMLAFLEIIDNPRQDIPLLSVMRSSIFGFTDKELALIKVGSHNDSYYDSVQKYRGIIKLEEKIHGFMKTVEAYRKISAGIPVDRLAWMIMQETGYFYSSNDCLSLESKQSNLRKLFEIAGEFEKSSMTGLFSFLRYIKAHIERSADTEGASLYGENSNVVRILSIHKCKGLEFPVVILSGCGKRFNKSESKESMVFDKELGFGPNYINSDKGYWLVTAPKKSIQVKAELEALAEEMRILYVALTRAREKLVITGYSDNFEKDSVKWLLKGRLRNGRINAGKVLGAAGHLEWIMTCLSGHENCSVVSEAAGFSLEGNDSGVPLFTVKAIYPEEIYALLEKREKIDEYRGKRIEIDINEIRRRFSWEYEHASGIAIPNKISVTELKKLRDRESAASDIFNVEFMERPEFMNGETGPDAAERGTLLHNVLAAVDPCRGGDLPYLRALLEKAGAKIEDLEWFAGIIGKFYTGELGQRVAAASNAVTEKAFICPLPTREIYPESDETIPIGHTTLLQGVVDCMFFEEGNAVIIDYKSDKVEPGLEELHARKYALQLGLYSRAIEHLTGIGVKEKFIYFLRTG
ncbi:MAG: helicase-exonuclease AddAB subunit AddA, partial [Clostridia bacterium]